MQNNLQNSPPIELTVRELQSNHYHTDKDLQVNTRIMVCQFIFSNYAWSISRGTDGNDSYRDCQPVDPSPQPRKRCQS